MSEVPVVSDDRDHESGIRVGVFVDVQNMYYSAKSLYNSKLNYGRLLPFISKGVRTIVVANAYILSKAEIKISDFNNMLYENGFDIKKKLMEFKTRTKPGGEEFQVNTISWEIGVVVDMLKWAPKLDCIALVSGNGNYIDAVRYLQDLCRVEVYSFEDSTAGILKREANDFIALDDAEDDNQSLLIPIKKEETNSNAKTEDEETEEDKENVGNKK